MTAVSKLVATLIEAGIPAPEAATLVARAIAELLQPKRNSDEGPCYVYGLVDPRTEQIFYVGVSKYPNFRLEQHRSDQLSSAYDLIQDMQDEGWQCGMEILQKFETRRQALDHELRLIRTLPGLVNVAGVE